MHYFLKIIFIPFSYSSVQPRIIFVQLPIAMQHPSPKLSGLRQQWFIMSHGFMELAGYFFCWSLLSFIMQLHSIGRLISVWDQQDFSLYSGLHPSIHPSIHNSFHSQVVQREQKQKLQDPVFFATSQWSKQVTRPVQIQRVRKQTPRFDKKCREVLQKKIQYDPLGDIIVTTYHILSQP